MISYIARLLWKRVLIQEGFQTGKRSLLVLAPEEKLADCLESVSKTYLGYTEIVAAALDADRKGENIWEIPVVADSSEIVDYACGQWVDEILIPPCGQDCYPKEMVRQFMEMGITVHSGIIRSDEFSGNRRQVEKIGGYTVITTSLNYGFPTGG